MAFKYSCFISYRHCQHDLGRRIVAEFHSGLAGELELFSLPAFLDNDGLEAGDFYNERLAHELCKSVCMVMICFPNYFSLDHSYCTREYFAMKGLEEQRLALLDDAEQKDKGLIIPVVFRGLKHLPEEITNNRLCKKFDSFLLSTPELHRHPDFAPSIKEIAEYVTGRCRVLLPLERNLRTDCDRFKLPTEADVRPWLEGIIHAPSFPILTEVSS
jgi:hypothetical protein